MRRDIDGDERIAGFAGGARPALTLEADLLAAGQACWNFDFDIFAGRKMHARFGALGRFRQRDGERGVQILPRGGGAEFLRLELRTEAAAALAARCAAAEHAAQNILKAAGATTAALSRRVRN